jgi:hypothetical protein
MEESAIIIITGAVFLIGAVTLLISARGKGDE